MSLTEIAIFGHRHRSVFEIEVQYQPKVWWYTLVQGIFIRPFLVV